jgi:hypothetical protein
MRMLEWNTTSACLRWQTTQMGRRIGFDVLEQQSSEHMVCLKQSVFASGRALFRLRYALIHAHHEREEI